MLKTEFLVHKKFGRRFLLYVRKENRVSRSKNRTIIIATSVLVVGVIVWSVWLTFILVSFLADNLAEISNY